MKKLAIGFIGVASPALAHHEVILATSVIPAALWIGGIAATGVAALWAGWRRK